MSNNSTATAQILPFRFEKREVRTLLIDDQPWFIASDVAAALEYSETEKLTRWLDDDEKAPHIVGTLGGNQRMTVINESGLYSAILRSRKAEAKRFKKWVTAEVLPAIRKHGHYKDQGQMRTLIGQTIGTDGFHCLAAVVDGKVRHLPTQMRRGAKNHIWSQVHKAFSVVSVEDIPAAGMDSVRNFIAAYVLEGEWLQREVLEGFGALIGRPLGLVERWMVCRDGNGTEQYKLIPSGANVMTHEQMLAEMLRPGQLCVSVEEMFKFVVAGMQYIKERTDHQSEMLKMRSRPH